MSALIDSSTTIKPCLTSLVKPHVTTGGSAYRAGVPRRKKKVKYEKARSPVQALFVRRLNELLEARELSDNALARLINPKSPGSIQRSVSRVTACTQDPTLEMVGLIVVALGIPPDTLFKDEGVKERTIPSHTLVKGSFRGAQSTLHRDTAKRNRHKGP